MGPGYHRMGPEGVGMSGQDQLFLRGVPTGVNADDNEPLFIWRGVDSTGFCCWMHALILCP